MTVELRDFTNNRASDSPSGTLTGYAAVFNSPSFDLGGFREILRPGCFAETLRNDDQVALIQHCDWLLLGRKSTGQLSLSEDNVGLRFTVRPPDTSVARDAIELVRSGVLQKCSFSFRCAEGDDEFVRPTGDDRLYTRLVHKVRLYEVSIVSSPAYGATSVKARARAAARSAASNLGRLKSDIQREEKLATYFELRDKARVSGRGWPEVNRLASDLHRVDGVPFLVLAQS